MLGYRVSLTDLKAFLTNEKNFSLNNEKIAKGKLTTEFKRSTGQIRLIDQDGV